MLGDLPQESGQDSNCPRPLLVKPLWGEGLASPAAGTQRNGGSAFRQAGWWGYPPPTFSMIAVGSSGRECVALCKENQIQATKRPRPGDWSRRRGCLPSERLGCLVP